MLRKNRVIAGRYVLKILDIIGKREALFATDIEIYSEDLKSIVASSRFLVIGGAGSIGQAVCREIFKRDPKLLHVVDISENNLVELVRDLRSSIGYGSGEFETFCLDCGSSEFAAMLRMNKRGYDFVLNLSALKHVRSESDPFTLMRLVRTNVFNSIQTIRQAREHGAQKYFCVSTDKAANPVNLMGASKRIMELFMMRESQSIDTAMARFANVAFSDGSLLHGFSQRLLKGQPLSAPSDVQRYFVTPQEAGELCLLSTLYGENLDVFFPKLAKELHLIRFSDIAQSFLLNRGYEPVSCESEQEARARVDELSSIGKWPCYFFETDTTGEKPFEEFYTDEEHIDWERFGSIGIIRNKSSYNDSALMYFERGINALIEKGYWTKADLVDLYRDLLPDLVHIETGKYLDQRM